MIFSYEEGNKQRNTSLKDNNNYQTEIPHYSQVYGILIIVKTIYSAVFTYLC